MNTHYEGIKSKEIVWHTYININGNLAYCVTSDIHRDSYYLYEYNESAAIWIKTKHKSNNPLNFNSIIKKDLFNNKDFTNTNKRQTKGKSKLF